MNGDRGHKNTPTLYLSSAGFHHRKGLQTGKRISSHLQKWEPGAASLGQRWRAALPKNLQRQIKLNDEGQGLVHSGPNTLLTEVSCGFGTWVPLKGLTGTAPRPQRTSRGLWAPIPRLHERCWPFCTNLMAGGAAAKGSPFPALPQPCAESWDRARYPMRGRGVERGKAWRDRGLLT